MRNFYSPLRYPGGKSCNFNFVSSLLCENKLIGIDYVEPYAGGAGLALRLLCEKYVDSIYLNDFDKAIYYFWSTILNDTDNFCSWIDAVDISIENWQFYKNIQNNKDNYTPLEIAKSTFFLNRCNISGVLKGGIIGGVNQKGKYKINARFNKNELIEKIILIEKFKDRIYLSNIDGISFTKKLNKRKKEYFFYFDPPYYQKGANLYLNFYNKNNHIELAKIIPSLKKKWIMSYDDNMFIIDLYKQNRKIQYSLKQSTSNRIGDEILIFDNNLTFNESKKYLSNVKILDI